jgi:hypothetical protein
MVFNALSQMNTNDEAPWILYRQRDQGRFLAAIGLDVARVDAHMTHDAHLVFATPQARAQAETVLRDARIGERPLFLVESYSDDPLKLFYRLQFTDPVAQDAVLTANGRSVRFFDQFEAIVQRTGRHIPFGTLYSDAPQVPATLYNHQVHDVVLDFFGKRQRELQALPESLFADMPLAAAG